MSTFQNIRLRFNIGILSALAFAGLTGLGALLVIPLPFTPVPITGQTFVVLLSGFLLGRKYGPLSQAFYLILGFLGVPWFAGGSSGLSVIYGATGGYLIGFIIASYTLGYITDLSKQTRTPVIILFLSALGTIIIYLFGVTGLMLATPYGLWKSLLLGFFPFLPGDILKMVLVFLTAFVLLPKEESQVDTGISTGRRNKILGLSLLVSIVSTAVFVSYLLSAGTTPPLDLAAFSLLTTLLVLPSLTYILRSEFLVPDL